MTRTFATIVGLILTVETLSACGISAPKDMVPRNISGPSWEVTYINDTPERAGAVPTTQAGAMGVVFGPETLRATLNCYLLVGKIDWNNDSLTISDTDLSMDENQSDNCAAGSKDTAQRIQKVLTGPLSINQASEFELVLQRTDQEATETTSPQSIRFVYGGL